MKIFLDTNICLDLLDNSRQNAPSSIKWYMENKNEDTLDFYFSGDFITTFYYVLTQKKKIKSALVIEAINQLCKEVIPIYLVHSDFLIAQQYFFKHRFDDLEDLIILHSAIRESCSKFMTNDKKLLNLKKLASVEILKPK
ncbi:type II toxin-antitoxin system VapC family toxin [Candidatus Nitrosacidococcus sp. I8]|uniref:type II toxin-antitoxin system VapC family toxin n=1 Tax=Candidatus Nitrosacidococcus sp. I8 TaxID=2942908 RepID=UPI0022263F5E|nr:PIN domain-containing protein [Candidatus Nitrosacidococcus sp. I8]CAH9016991.1 hypothetical protein NURINAE_00275 [Candidatus Nitrosacidococcus sp. I8]